MKTVRYFTPEEARKSLPLVKRIIRDIINTGEQMRSIAAKLNGNVIENPGLKELAVNINGFIQELEDLGCYYKDWNFTIGLVDFPSIIGGKEVMLCWRSDEEEIRFYHDPEEGFAGRKPIPEEYFFSPNTD